MVMINGSIDLSGKLRELEIELDRMARDFQEKETKVAELKEALNAALEGSKQKDSDMIRQQRDIEREREEKRELERTASRLKLELQKAENELSATRREHDRHHQELQRFQQEYARAQATARMGDRKK